jgi:hypothetical protein
MDEGVEEENEISKGVGEYAQKETREGSARTCSPS